MNTEPTGLFQGLSPLLANRTVIFTVSADGTGLLTLNVIPKKVKDDESDALTTALCITATAAELDRDLPGHLREYTDAHVRAACNIQRVKDDLAAAEKAEREAADEKRAKRGKAKAVPPAPQKGQADPSPSLFDQCEPEGKDANVDIEPSDTGAAKIQSSDYPD